MRAFVYCRISDDRVGAGLGVDRQLGDCKQVADQHGWTIVRTFVDNDISAASGKPRPDYLAMLDALRRREADAVIAWHNDRLHRTPLELEEFISVCGTGSIIVRTVKAGELDLSTPTGQMNARIVGAVSRHEVDHARQRMVSAHLQHAEMGKPRGRHPYGYGPKYDDTGRFVGRVKHEKEAAVVREIADRVLSGESVRSIVLDLNGRPPAGRDKRWTVGHLRDMILRPTYAGIRTYRGENGRPGLWEPIITEDEHLRLCAILKDPSRRTARGNAPKWLLSGIATCDVCDARMWQKKSNGNPAYQCRDRGCVSKLVEPVDMMIERAIVERLRRMTDATDLIEPGQMALAKKAHEEARSIRARLTGFIDQAADGQLSPEALARIEQKLKPKIAELESVGMRYVAPEVVELLGENAQATWDRMGLEDRRNVVRALVDVRISKSSGNRKVFDPSTVRVSWK